MTDLFDIPALSPLAYFGLTSKFWNIHPYTLFYTWTVLAIVIIVIFITQYGLKKDHDIITYCLISFVKTFKTLCQQTLGSYSQGHTSFILTLFSFIMLSNTLAVIPGLEEPTSDLNTTLALGITSFLYVQVNSFFARGFLGYVWEFFQPFFFLMPLNVIGELASVMSMSFRLFGNIFGGLIISHLYLGAIGGSILWEVVGILSGLNMTIILFLGMFVGIIQAFVFSILSLTYLSLAINVDEEE